MPNQGICYLCKRQKIVADSGVGVCPRCDVAGPLVWPNDFAEWEKGDPMPKPFIGSRILLCGTCDGTGVSVVPIVTYTDGTYKYLTKPCGSCRGECQV